MIENLKMDWRRNEKKFPVIFVLFLYRIGNYVHYSFINKFIKRIITIFLKILYNTIMLIFQCEIPFTAKIDGGVRIRHLSGIIINNNTIIGKNCTLFHQVTIGSNEHKRINGGTIIGNDVYIGCGAKVIGNINIGDNTIIGANAVITKNIEENSIVVESNKIIKNNRL